MARGSRPFRRDTLLEFARSLRPSKQFVETIQKVHDGGGSTGGRPCITVQPVRRGGRERRSQAVGVPAGEGKRTGGSDCRFGRSSLRTVGPKMFGME